MKKQLLLFILTLLPMLAMADASGSCGTNVTWTYTSSTNTLTIQGSGAMDDYNPTLTPWYSYRTSIKTVIIEEGVTSIGNHAFNLCSGLTSVIIGNSVKSIGKQAFDSCSSLTFVTIGNSVTNIGSYAFEYCSELKSIIIPNSVTSIGGAAFSNCTGLTSVTIGNSVTSIGSSAFFGCSGLTSVSIPNSVKSIGEWAFAGSSGLKSIYSMIEDVFTIRQNTFDDATYNKAILYVPIGKRVAYKSTDGWKNFTNIEEFDVTNIAAQYRSKDAKIVDVYQLNGQRSNDVRRGINIIRMSDGTTRKVVSKSPLSHQ